MKTLFFSLVSFSMLLIGCSHDFEEPLPARPDMPVVQSRTSVVPIEEALGELDAVLNAIAQDTRSNGAFDCTRSIGEIQVSGGALATRSGENDLPDTMAYVVNFTDGRGFAVLGAQRTLEPVYAITESGSFDAAKLDEAIARAEKRRQLPTPDTRADEADARPLTDIGTDFAYELLAEAMVAQPRIVGPEILEETHGDWIPDKMSTIGPLVKVKWSNGYPFNMSTPITDNGKNCSLNISSVIIAQMMSCTRKPNYAPSAEGSYAWNLFTNISNYMTLANYTYTNYSKNVSALDQSRTKMLANFLAYLDVCFQTKYDTSTGKGSAPVGYIVNGLKNLDPVHYANAKLVNLANSTIKQLYQSLDQQKPVFTMGSVGSLFTTVWVTDGYVKCSRKVTQKVLYPSTGQTSINHFEEQNRMLHLNWGQHGIYDGYYIERIFDYSKRQYTDDVIDANIPERDEQYPDWGINAFNDSNKMILY